MNEISHWKEKARKAEAERDTLKEQVQHRDRLLEAAGLRETIANEKIYDLMAERDELRVLDEENTAKITELVRSGVEGGDAATKLIAARAKELKAERDALKTASSDADIFKRMYQKMEKRCHARTAQVARLREALEGVCNFAWSLASIKGNEARNNINGKLDEARQALAETPAQSLSAVRNEVLDEVDKIVVGEMNHNAIHAMKEADND